MEYTEHLREPGWAWNGWRRRWGRVRPTLPPRSIHGWVMLSAPLQIHLGLARTIIPVKRSREAPVAFSIEM
jgi:hypothetical protein